MACIDKHFTALVQAEERRKAVVDRIHKKQEEELRAQREAEEAIRKIKQVVTTLITVLVIRYCCLHPVTAGTRTRA
jgi:ribosomal protein L17